ncbi:hypothetical protein MPDQ_007947 [Monascus purpureus]|uniref:Indole-diterpene biosynthesis protein PaxU n=1 Tax=Monascus purpureus TaxID=5098 RepID=A0A507QUH9_MONPU|nr:hypothetical protein MPDQ_007947 [Monascus purpureus]BDD55811.1 hypothetical protein MAP00_001296 [Monascus purpureus]
MAGKTTGEDPLAPFVRLSSCVYLRQPSSQSGHDGRLYPKTIVIAFWMNAPPRTLVKYVTEYTRLAPSATIIFIRTSSSDFLVRGMAWAQRVRVAPAVQAIRTASPKADAPVFLHMFSNGGASATAYLLETYRGVTGEPLCISSMIIDSAPGTLALNPSVKAFSFVLPKLWLWRLLGKAFLYVILISGWLLRKLTRMPDAVTHARTVLNNSRLIRAPDSNSGLRRCYLYSDADELIDWRDVESHAADAESKGWIVQKEMFLGTPHVEHMRAHPVRYWSIVKTFLEIQAKEREVIVAN